MALDRDAGDGQPPLLAETVQAIAAPDSGIVHIGEAEAAFECSGRSGDPGACRQRGLEAEARGDPVQIGLRRAAVGDPQAERHVRGQSKGIRRLEGSQPERPGRAS